MATIGDCQATHVAKISTAVGASYSREVDLVALKVYGNIVAETSYRIGLTIVDNIKTVKPKTLIDIGRVEVEPKVWLVLYREIRVQLKGQGMDGRVEGRRDIIFIKG